MYQCFLTQEKRVLLLSNSIVNGEAFFDFLRGVLFPLTMPYYNNGVNPHSILVNAR